MRRGNKRKFGREINQRKALHKALATALVDHGKIKTTEAKAKALSTHINKIITKSIKGDAHSRRLLLKELSPKAVNKLLSELAPKLKDKKGGYTRLLKLGQRKSDGAEMAIIEFTA